ncbi:MAG: putative quinol monooxygenase [Acidobacteriota bacterium]
MLVVTVLIEIDPGHFEAFREAVLKNAAGSLYEPGCFQFDVSFSEDRKHCFLYEVYSDQAAFGDHQATPHFKEFASVSKPMVASKRLQTFIRHSGQSS